MKPDAFPEIAEPAEALCPGNFGLSYYYLQRHNKTLSGKVVPTRRAGLRALERFYGKQQN
jgi:hypothetical protein